MFQHLADHIDISTGCVVRILELDHIGQFPPEIGQAIEEKKVLDDELTEQIIEVAKKFKENR